MSLLNKAAVRRFLLENAETLRAHKFERVSADTVERVEAHLRQHLTGIIRSAPSKGKTL